jgi:hypothetical protein
LFAVTLSLLFLLAKYAEGRWINWEKDRPWKHLLRDALLVMALSAGVFYASVHYDSYLQDFFGTITGVKKLIPDKAQIFTGDPEF